MVNNGVGDNDAPEDNAARFQALAHDDPVSSGSSPLPVILGLDIPSFRHPRARPEDLSAAKDGKSRARCLGRPILGSSPRMTTREARMTIREPEDDVRGRVFAFAGLFLKATIAARR